MKLVRTGSVWAVAAVLTWNTVAWSQLAPATPGTPGLQQSAADNVRFGPLAARTPGNMVNAGVVRSVQAGNFTRGGIEIVETTIPTSPKAVFLADAIEIIFDQLNSTLLYLGNILLQRAGLPPLVPPVTPPTTDENVDDGSTDGVSDDELRDPIRGK